MPRGRLAQEVQMEGTDHLVGAAQPLAHSVQDVMGLTYGSAEAKPIPAIRFKTCNLLPSLGSLNSYPAKPCLIVGPHSE